MAPSKAKLTRADVGAWVLKGNPRGNCEYFVALENGYRRPGSVVKASWTVGRTYRTHLVAPGDLMVLWITGANDPGIYEIGTVTGRAEAVDGARPFVVAYISVFLRHRVSRADLRADPVLGGAEQFRIPVIGNPTYLTPAERDALLPLVARTDLRAAGWPEAPV